MTRHISHVGPLVFADALDEAVSGSNSETEHTRREQAMKGLSRDRVRNTLGSRGELSPSHAQLAGQFERVIRGERLSKKRGAGFFSVPTDGRRKR